jgi:hypothetical protein
VTAPVRHAAPATPDRRPRNIRELFSNAAFSDITARTSKKNRARRAKIRCTNESISYVVSAMEVKRLAITAQLQDAELVSPSEKELRCR